MKVTFVRWCLNEADRNPVSVEPKRVDCVEHFGHPFTAGTGEDFPAATRIIMAGKQEYLVQGSVAEITAKLNAPDKFESVANTMADVLEDLCERVYGSGEYRQDAEEAFAAYRRAKVIPESA